MKVYYKSPIIIASIQLLLLSAFALYILLGVLEEKAIWNLDSLLSFILKFKFYLSSILLTSVFILKLKKVGLYLFVISGLVFLFHNSAILYKNFNKLSLIFISFFVTLFFYFFFLLRNELQKSYTKAYFFKNYVENKPQVELKVFLKTQNQSLEGTLLNWDKHGCYIALEEPLKFTKEKIWLDFPYENRVFQDRGVIATMSKNKKLIGVYIKNNKHFSEEKKFKWVSLVQILNDRAIIPERIH